MIKYYIIKLIKKLSILTKAGRIIQSQTGLRINDVLSIRKGCIHTTIDVYDYREVTLGKIEKGGHMSHKIYLIVQLVNMEELKDENNRLK